MPSIALQTLPVSALIAALVVASGSSLRRMLDEGSTPVVSDAVEIVCWLAFAYGMALTATLLSWTHVGDAGTSAYLPTARRLLPWIVTWILVFFATLVGLLLLVIPGIIVGIRLFWADEFALVHSAGPLAACRESRALTEGRAGAIFGFQFVLGMAEYLVLIPGLLLFLALVWAFGSLPSSQAISFVELLLSTTLAFVLYGSAHAPEIVYFYGLRARRAQRTS